VVTLEETAHRDLFEDALSALGRLFGAKNLCFRLSESDLQMSAVRGNEYKFALLLGAKDISMESRFWGLQLFPAVDLGALGLLPYQNTLRCVTSWRQSFTSRSASPQRLWVYLGPYTVQRSNRPELNIRMCYCAIVLPEMMYTL
jgi:hypothetical protein